MVATLKKRWINVFDYSADCGTLDEAPQPSKVPAQAACVLSASSAADTASRQLL